MVYASWTCFNPRLAIAHEATGGCRTVGWLLRSFNPRLAIAHEATGPVEKLALAPTSFNPRLAIAHEATVCGWLAWGDRVVSIRASRLLTRRPAPVGHG